MDQEIVEVDISGGVLNDAAEARPQEQTLASVKDYDACDEEGDTAESSIRTFSDNLLLSITQPEENTIANINPYSAQQQDDISEASVQGDFPEHLILPIADEFGQPARYPGENVSFRSQKEDEVDDLNAPRSIVTAGFESFKYIYSLVLLIFSVVVVMASIFSRQTTATQDMNIHPALAFFIFWFLIFWLGMMEGGQGSIVGLKSIDKQLYAESHPKAFKCTTLAHKGDNTKRFIVGRQFLVVLVVFISNLVSTPVEGSKVLGLSNGVTDVFLTSGIALILTTIMIGQLSVQINAANCMLDFINNYFMLVTTYVSLAIEFSGLMHSVYLVQIFFCKVTGERIESNEPSRTALQSLFFWARVLFSTVLLGFAFAVTVTALFDGKTKMWEGVPPVASVVIFLLLVCFVGIMEGMQIALFAVINMPEEVLMRSNIAKKNCELAFKSQNLQALLIGRQICVTCCMFVVARITTLDVDVDAGEDTIFGVSKGVQEFFNTGLLGAVITTIVASLGWRVIASSFPLAFLSNPLIFLVIRLCLFIEASGLCSASWVLARLTKLLVGLQPDAVHLKGAEPHTTQPVTRRDKDIDRTLAVSRYLYSLVLLVFSVVVVMAAIFSEQTLGTKEKGIHSVVAFFIFWLLIFWLAMMEGGQGALVGLQSINKETYSESHPRTLKCTTLAHKGDNMGRFIVGRQFLVVLVLFASNLMSSASEGATVLGLPDFLNDLFFASGIALILITIMIGQLTAQINAANCMLDFINNYLMLFTTYISLGIEFSGIMHSVYLVRTISSKATGTPILSNEPPKTVSQNLFFWARVFVSLFILGFSLAVTLAALFQGKTTAWDGVPKPVSVVIFLILLCFVGMMEGMQIALFAVLNMEEEKLQRHSIAHANCKLAFSGQNLQAFLIGRQICVTICTFVIARITTLDIDIGAGDGTIFGVSNGVQEFFNTGILGAIITTIIGSLSWRIAASTFPLTFLSNPLIYIILRLCHVFEASGLCSASWLLARWNKLLVKYQPDEVYLDGAEPHGKEPVTKRDKDVDVTVSAIKYGYSLALLLFSVTVVMAAIFSRQTKVALNTHPAVAFLAFWFLLIWLGMMEGGQGCLVGLQPVDKNIYKKSHPVTHKCTTVAHKDKNMERFIVGRQFLVVLVVFVTNLCGAAVEDASVLGLSDAVNQIFLTSGVAIILTTIMIGQLTAQVNAANCMIDFINNYFMLFTIYVSLAIEFSGLLHSVYLVQIFFSKVADKSKPAIQPRSAWQNLFFWIRVLLSIVVLGFAFAVSLAAIFQGLTTMWDGIPSTGSVVLFFVLMCFVGVMDGMQIALFSVFNMPEEDIAKSPLAKKSCKLAFSGRNLQAFLVGRQICVTVCMFVVARISTLDVDVDAGEEPIFGVSKGVQDFFNTGLLGAVITTIVASLIWRVIASSFPLAFLSNPLIYVIIRLCLIVEASGLCSASWLLAIVHKQVAGFDPDEVHISNAESQKDCVDQIAESTSTEEEKSPEAEDSLSERDLESTSVVFH